jgi:hypothetical protein
LWVNLAEAAANYLLLIDTLVTAPALEAVLPMIKKFQPELEFQIGSAEEVEAVWQAALERELNRSRKHVWEAYLDLV